MFINKQLFICEVQGKMLSSVKLEMFWANKQTQMVYIGFGAHAQKWHHLSCDYVTISHQVAPKNENMVPSHLHPVTYRYWMVTHLSTIIGLDCLNSLILPFTLTASTFGWCLYCANVSLYKDGWAVNFKFFYKGMIGSPAWMPQLKHNTIMN